jgi:hypothetical protein
MSQNFYISTDLFSSQNLVFGQTSEPGAIAAKLAKREFKRGLVPRVELAQKKEEKERTKKQKFAGSHYVEVSFFGNFIGC